MNNERIGEFLGYLDWAVEEVIMKEQSEYPARHLEQFFTEIRESLGVHAQRKGYNETGADGPNLLYEFTHHIGASAGHSMGEIVYKATEYMKEPRDVLLVKIASWAFLEWKYRSSPSTRCDECGLPFDSK